MLIPLLLIALSSLCLSIMAIMRKKYQNGLGAGLESTMFFVATTSIISFIVSVMFAENFSFFSETFLIAALYATVSVASCSLCIVGPKYGNLSVVIMFATLGGLVLSTVFGLLVDPFDIKKDFWQIIGLALVLVIIAISFSSEKTEKKEEKEEKEEKEVQINKGKRIYNIICILLFFINGSGSVIFKIKTEFYPQAGNYEFIAQTALAGVLIAGLIFVICRLKAEKKGEDKILLKEYFTFTAFLPILIYGAMYFISDFSGLVTTQMLPLIVKAGLSFSLPLIMTAIFDFIAYKQKPGKSNYIQMLLALVCCILFSL